MKKRFFRTLIIVLAAGLLFAAAGDLAAQAKNIILMIGDGMGPSQYGAAWLYSNRVLNKDLRMVDVMKSNRTAYIVNDTADAIVTESAAAAAQIATGQRMTARALSMTPDGKKPVETIMEIAKKKLGKAVGLVTTSGITDATPGAFSAHVPNRADEAGVADQELKLGVDVLMGGRKQFFLPDSVPGGKRTDKRDLTVEAAKAGYTVVGTADELKAAKGRKILGLFNISNMSYEIDRPDTKEPSLAEMTDKTLQTLKANPKGFFAMIEGGRIDHAAHRNDAPTTITDTIAFDAAVGVALDFAKKNPGTLVIVTADHETGGMGLIGHSKESKEYIGIDLKAIQKATMSFELMMEKAGKKPSAETIKAGVKQYLSIDITDKEAQFIAEDQIKKADPFNYSYDYLHSLAFVLRPYYRVGFASQTHTASPLMAFAFGPGSERIGGQMHNTQLFNVMKAVLK